MTPRERIDFLVVTLFFGAFVGASGAASVLSAEWFVRDIMSFSSQGVLIHITEFMRSNLLDIHL